MIAAAVAVSHLEVAEVASAAEDAVDTQMLVLPRQCSPWDPSFTQSRARCSASRPMPSTSHTSMLPSTSKTSRKLARSTRFSAPSTKFTSQSKWTQAW